jgi:hypothetical protein
LGGESVELEGGKKANDPVRHPAARLGKTVVFRNLCVRKDIDPAGRPLQNPLPVKPGEINTRNPFGRKVFRPKYAEAPGEGE